MFSRIISSSSVATTTHVTSGLALFFCLYAFCCAGNDSTGELKFLAVGCGPYKQMEQAWLEDCIALENSRDQGEFFVHLGDLIPGGKSAPPSYYEKIALTLRRSEMPGFIVPGDNEWNDQVDPDNAWEVWSGIFMNHHSFWDYGGSLRKKYPTSAGVQHSTRHAENFSFVCRGVLVVGINLTGGRIHDASERDQRLLDNAHWIRQNYQQFHAQVRGAVVLAQAAPSDSFITPFLIASKAFGKPVLYLHAHGHKWSVRRPWPEQNIIKVQTDRLGIAPPLLVTVREEGEELFEFERQFMRGPYLALGTPHSMRIVWRTRRAIEPVVRYGLLRRRLNRSTSRDNILVKTKDQTRSLRTLHSSADGVLQYEATLNGLEPSTTYYYEVYDGEQLLAGGDSTYQFTTHPQPGKKSRLRFWVVGDSGTGGQKQFEVHQALRSFTHSPRKAPDVFLHVGDMAYSNGTDQEFEHHFFMPYRRTLRNTVCWPAMGNHEGSTSSGVTGIGPYFDSFVLPEGGEAGGVASGREAYYSFDYGNIHFISLNSHDLNRSPDAPMAQWLRADLERTTADWIFAYWHHPPYTKGSHDSDTEIQLIEMRENIMPILESGGVDMVFTGHSHIYERSMLIDGAYSTPTTVDGVVLDDGSGDPGGDGAYRKSEGLQPHEGTVVIVTGHGGAGLRRMGTMPVMRRVIYPEHGSVIVDVNDDSATAIMLNSKGVERDIFRIVKRGTVVPNRIENPFQLPHEAGGK